MKSIFQGNGLTGAFLTVVIATVLTSCGKNPDPVARNPLQRAPGNGSAARNQQAQRDTIRFTGFPGDLRLDWQGKNRISQVLGPYVTSVRADSICWEMVYASPGIALRPASGKGSFSRVTFFPTDGWRNGEVIIRAVPWRTGYVSKPMAFAVIFGQGTDSRILPQPNSLSGKGSCSCPPDTAAVNRSRRRAISEFTDLLYMYARTTSPREKEYFRTGAEKKLRELPSGLPDIKPNSCLTDLFNGRTTTIPLVIPAYDERRCYITGITVSPH